MCRADAKHPLFLYNKDGDIMSIERELFKRMIPMYDKLIDYGFTKQDHLYTYHKRFMNDEFEAQVFVKDDRVSGKVIDLFSDEEYVLMRMKKRGSYASEVRKHYLKILEDIARHCFLESAFIDLQTNQLVNWIEDTYHDEPEFTFKDTDICVFRHQENKKWYGLIMTVDRSLFTDEEGEVEVIDLKIDPQDKDSLLQTTGIYEAYHMNKTHWISIILDGSVDINIIKEIVTRSYLLTSTGIRTEKKTWIIPANATYFDVEEYIDTDDIFLWKQSGKVHVGDIVYIYFSAPYSCIMYKTEAIEVNRPYIYNNKKQGMTMNLKKLKKFTRGKWSFSKLNTYGVKAVRGPRGIPEKLIEDIEKDF